MKLGEELRREMPKLTALPRTATWVREPQCEGVIPHPYWLPKGAPQRCRNKARFDVDGKNLCTVHARITARTEPTHSEVVAFLAKEREAKSDLWRSIVKACKKARAG